ncbi:MAG: hypothetical protein M3277_01980 [Actinomycetota bacterium]|nr:hypothetical protein [Actinomycetota bacterium]
MAGAEALHAHRSAAALIYEACAPPDGGAQALVSLTRARVRTLVAHEAPTAESEEMMGRMAGNFDLLVGWPERPERTLASASRYRPLECTRSTL